jgi:hypothetical protein
VIGLPKFVWCLAFGLIATLAACQFPPFGGLHVPGEARSISLDPPRTILHVASASVPSGLYPNARRFDVKEMREGKAQILSEGVSWESSDPGVAVVGRDGTVRAVAPGSMVLKARLIGLDVPAATAAVTVTAGGRADVTLD